MTALTTNQPSLLAFGVTQGKWDAVVALLEAQLRPALNASFRIHPVSINAFRYEHHHWIVSKVELILREGITDAQWTAIHQHWIDNIYSATF